VPVSYPAKVLIADVPLGVGRFVKRKSRAIGTGPNGGGIGLNDQAHGGGGGLFRRVEANLHEQVFLAWDVPGMEEFVLIVQGIDIRSDGQLSQVTQALCAFAFLFGRCQGGQQHCRQDGNNGDDNQKFDQSEGVTASGPPDHSKTSDGARFPGQPIHKILCFGLDALGGL